MRMWHADRDERQQAGDRSFIGGVPLLPAGVAVPTFDKTSTEMTFFFQIELPPHHGWAGYVVSVFAVTDFVDDESYIPKLPRPLAGAVLDRPFFDDYETFFRLFVFRADAAGMVADYAEKVAFRRLQVSDQVPAGAIAFGRINEAPTWILDDESPKSFAGRADLVRFLFQTQIDYEFVTVRAARRQKTQDYASATSGLKDSLTSEYKLFVANELYVFGIDDEEKRVYIVPQS